MMMTDIRDFVMSILNITALIASLLLTDYNAHACYHSYAYAHHEDVVPHPSFLSISLACFASLLKMSDARPKLNELALELKTLKWADVISIAIQLNVQFPTLQRIAEQHSDINTRVLEAMNCWLEADTTASWKKLASALKSIEKMVLAQKIKEKYIRQPTPPSDSSQPQTSRAVRRRPQPAGEWIYSI